MITDCRIVRAVIESVQGIPVDQEDACRRRDTLKATFDQVTPYSNLGGHWRHRLNEEIAALSPYC